MKARALMRENSKEVIVDIEELIFSKERFLEVEGSDDIPSFVDEIDGKVAIFKAGNNVGGCGIFLVIRDWCVDE